MPIFLGSNFAFLAAFAAIAPKIDGKMNMEMMPYALGGVVAAGAVYLVLLLFNCLAKTG